MTKGKKTGYDFEKTVDNYLAQVGRYLPISESKKKSALSDVREDVLEALQQSGKKHPDPTKVFGDPYQVAKDVGMANNWKDRHASFLRRFGAYCIDVFIIITLIIGVWIIPGIISDIFLKSNGSVGLGMITGILISILQFMLMSICWLIYFPVFEWRYSTTPGKKLFGLVVCDKSGVRISLEQAVIRNLSKAFEFLFWDWLIARIINKPNVLRLLDKVAKTRVIYAK